MPARSTDLHRCAWAQKEPLIAYHDEEWGVPLHDDCKLFEFLILEGAQAGLSWETILKRRAGYREAFDGFDPRQVARYEAVQQEFGSFDRYLWPWGRDRSTDATDAAGGRVTRTAVSDALSKDLRARGFRFVGTTIIYALMQAVGMVNGHDPACFRRREIAA
jgi:DNA-3-methyladenine glycosylase I